MMVAVPGVAIMDAGTVTVMLVPLVPGLPLSVVFPAGPCQEMLRQDEISQSKNPLPESVRVNGGPPAETLEGENELINGCAATARNGCAAATPSASAKRNVRRRAVFIGLPPAAARSRAREQIRSAAGWNRHRITRVARRHRP